MVKRVGTWWIRDGLNARRDEAQGFGEMLSIHSSFDWTEDHGDGAVLRRDFVETDDYTEKVDLVDLMFLCTHGSYDPDVPSTYGHAFVTWDGTVDVDDESDWGKWDLELFSSHACRLLYHSSSNSVGRWRWAFERLHYMFGFHTPSYSGTVQAARGEKFAFLAALHLFFPFMPPYTLREAWKQANVEVEDDDVRWAYLRANGETSTGEYVSTYSETLETSEPKDPKNNQSFYTANGIC